MKTMPYTISNNYGTHLDNTGHALVWNCAVAGCDHTGSGNGRDLVERSAARHSVTHTEAELASTGYAVRVNYGALANERLASERRAKLIKGAIGLKF